MHKYLLSIIQLFTFLLLWVVSSASVANVSLGAAGRDQIISFTGKAYDLESGALLYTEYHEIEIDSEGNRKTGTVKYKNADDVLMAKKSLEYDDTGFFPSFNFLDLRSDQIINVTRNGDEIDLTLGRASSLELETVASLENRIMIADAGFDVFMLKNWEKLLNGERKEVEFLAPTRGIFVTFYIEQTFISESRVGFILAPDNFLIGLLVDPILLEYDRDTGRILSYKGLTNLEKVEGNTPLGENYVAEITYQY